VTNALPALLSVVAFVISACGGEEDAADVEAETAPGVAGLEVECTPKAGLGDTIDVSAGWKPGDRFSFDASFSKVDSDDETESFEATRSGEFTVSATTQHGTEIDWVMEDGLSVTFNNEPPERFSEIFGNDPAVSGPFEVRFAASPDGALKKVLNTDELRATGEQMVKSAIAESGGEMDVADLAPLTDLLTSGAFIKTEFIEKPFLMHYPYGYRIDTRRPVSTPQRFFLSFGGKLRGTETVEVIDTETDEGCVELQIQSEPDPEALLDAVERIGDQIPGFETDSPLSDIRLLTTLTATYDASAGLVRRVDQTREVFIPGENAELRDTFVISPASP